MILVLKPKFANVLAEQSCELRVRDTGGRTPRRPLPCAVAAIGQPEHNAGTTTVKVVATLISEKGKPASSPAP